MDHHLWEDREVLEEEVAEGHKNRRVHRERNQNPNNHHRLLASFLQLLHRLIGCLLLFDSKFLLTIELGQFLEENGGDLFTGDSALMPSKGPSGDGYGPGVPDGEAVPPMVCFLFW